MKRFLNIILLALCVLTLAGCKPEETPPETVDDITPEEDEDGGTEVAEINAEAIKRAEELAQEVIKERTRADIFEGLYHDLFGKSLRAVV